MSTTQSGKTGRCASIARTFAAFTLAAACTAHAGTLQPEMGPFYGSGYEFGDTRNGIGLQAGIDYFLDNGVGARALLIGVADPYGNLGLSRRGLNGFVGMQLVDSIPLGGQWSALVGAGLGQTSYILPDDSTESDEETDGIATVGIQWKPGKRFQMSLQYSYLTTSAVSATSLQFQVPF
jgi:hypothetical protein